jgi:ferredoxin
MVRLQRCLRIAKSLKQNKGETIMAMKILEDCISCGACEPVCPVEAIYEGDEIFEIDPDVCVECEGHYDTQQCVDVCPVDCIVQA